MIAQTQRMAAMCAAALALTAIVVGAMDAHGDAAQEEQFNEAAGAVARALDDASALDGAWTRTAGAGGGFDIELPSAGKTDYTITVAANAVSVSGSGAHPAACALAGPVHPWTPAGAVTGDSAARIDGLANIAKFSSREGFRIIRTEDASGARLTFVCGISPGDEFDCLSGLLDAADPHKSSSGPTAYTVRTETVVTSAAAACTSEGRTAGAALHGVHLWDIAKLAADGATMDEVARLDASGPDMLRLSPGARLHIAWRTVSIGGSDWGADAESIQLFLWVQDRP